MAISIDGIATLGTIFDEEIEINSRNIVIPRVIGSTDNTTIANLFGKTRTIILTGSFSGTDSVINTFILDVEAWVNVNTQTGANYTNSFGTTYPVLASVFRWIRTAPGNRILYTLIMTEGGALNAFS